MIYKQNLRFSKLFTYVYEVFFFVFCVGIKEYATELYTFLYNIWTFYQQQNEKKKEKIKKVPIKTQNYMSTGITFQCYFLF